MSDYADEPTKTFGTVLLIVLGALIFWFVITERDKLHEKKLNAERAKWIQFYLDHYPPFKPGSFARWESKQ